MPEQGSRPARAEVDQSLVELRASYDRMAEPYADQYFHELEHKPLDRELLDRFAERVQSLGPVCDLGCGPGQIGRYLHGRGVDVFGVDLSPGMVELARKLNPDMEFRTGNMLSLSIPEGSLGGIAAFYSIIHVPREKVTLALGELKRVLRPGGVLLLSFHVGQEVLHLDEWEGKKVSVDFTFFSRSEMEGYLESVGLEVEDTIERLPYKDVEFQSRRAYVFATNLSRNAPLKERTG